MSASGGGIDLTVGAADPLTLLTPALRKRISIDPAVLGGEPRIQGTRIAVAHVVAAALVGGPAEVRRQFPLLTDEDIEAAGLFAREVLERPGAGADLLWCF